MKYLSFAIEKYSFVLHFCNRIAFIIVTKFRCKIGASVNIYLKNYYESIENWSLGKLNSQLEIKLKLRSDKIIMVPRDRHQAIIKHQKKNIG